MICRKGYFNQFSCSDSQWCCGDTCCDVPGSTIDSSDSSMDDFFVLAIILVILVFCPAWCYKCFCRRTTNRGRVIVPPANTVTIRVPPQQATQQVPYPSVAPYPSVVLYPQQTPYLPPQPVNPHYNAPPPAYTPTAQAGMQQSPSAPPLLDI